MSKLTKEDHDTARKALTMYERMTGERSAHLIDSIEVENPEADAKARADAAQKAYDDQVHLTARVEATQQAERQARSAVTPDNVQPGNPGPGQEALATERAKSQGITRHGQEPDIARRGAA